MMMWMEMVFLVPQICAHTIVGMMRMQTVFVRILITVHAFLTPIKAISMGMEGVMYVTSSNRLMFL